MGYKSPWIMHRYGSVLLWYALPYTRFIHIVLTMNQLSQVPPPPIHIRRIETKKNRNQSRLRHNHNRPAPPRPPHSPTASSSKGTLPYPTPSLPHPSPDPPQQTHPNKKYIDSPSRRLRPRLLHNNNPNNPNFHNQEPKNLHRQSTHRHLVGCGNQFGRMSPSNSPLLTLPLPPT